MRRSMVPIASLLLLSAACGKGGGGSPASGAPAAVGNLVAVATNGQVQLSWSAVDRATSYAVLRGQSAGGAYQELTRTSATSYIDASATADVTYYYVVDALNGAGAAPHSNEASATLRVATLAPPEGLSARQSADGSVTLSWNATPHATSYKILRGTSAGGESAVPIATAAASPYIDHATIAGATYYYRVIAGAAGYPDSAPSAEASVNAPSNAPHIAGCQILPDRHIFNLPIDRLPVDANSAAYLNTIGTHHLHLDLGTAVDMTRSDYYGIPYNVVHGNARAWLAVNYHSSDPGLSWDARAESDCGTPGSGGVPPIASPCTAAAAPAAVFPIPAAPLIEGGIDTNPSQPYGDHHLLILDADNCRLWELYHTYPDGHGSWDIFGSATFDLNSTALRPAGWTSADAAGFPILPLLLRADEASSGVIRHALRFTIQSRKIRNEYVWPARHLTSSGTSSHALPPMGQLFRLKSSYQIPATFNDQSRAILKAMQTYGLYIADGGSDLFVTGEPSAGWASDTFSQVQSVGSSDLEAVDLTPIHQRTGFDPNSAAVP